jgi:hypothetical protein
MKIITILKGFLIGIIVLGIMFLLPDSKEGFVPKRYDIAPKKYSVAHSKNLLGNAYKEKQLNNDTYFTISKLYPKTPMGSYAQITNNQKINMKTCNGTSIRANMCQSMNPVQSSIPEITPSQPPQVSCNRVNYYCVPDNNRI